MDRLVAWTSTIPGAGDSNYSSSSANVSLFATRPQMRFTALQQAWSATRPQVWSPTLLQVRSTTFGQVFTPLCQKCCPLVYNKCGLPVCHKCGPPLWHKCCIHSAKSLVSSVVPHSAPQMWSLPKSRTQSVLLRAGRPQWRFCPSLDWPAFIAGTPASG